MLKDLTYNGIKYPSQRAAEKALHISQVTIRTIEQEHGFTTLQEIMDWREETKEERRIQSIENRRQGLRRWYRDFSDRDKIKNKMEKMREGRKEYCKNLKDSRSVKKTVQIVQNTVYSELDWYTELLPDHDRIMANCKRAMEEQEHKYWLRMDEISLERLASHFAR